MARRITPERQELIVEAIRLRKAGWSQSEIGRALAIPRPTIHLWITNNGEAGTKYQQYIPNKHPRNKIVMNTPSPITLFPCKYEEVGDGIALASVGLILTDPPYQASSNNLSRTLQKTDLRRYKCRVCGRTFKNYYLLEEKRVCPRCLREDNHG